jgi:hypothetical protein
MNFQVLDLGKPPRPAATPPQEENLLRRQFINQRGTGPQQTCTIMNCTAAKQIIAKKDTFLSRELFN